MFLSIYSIHLSFPTFNIKMIDFCTLRIVTSTLSNFLKYFCESQKNIFKFSYGFLDVLVGCKF